MYKLKINIVLAVITAFGVLSCGNSLERTYVSNQQSISRIRTVAILQLENLTQFPEAGAIVTDIFTTALYASNRFRIVEKTELDKLLQTRNITMPEVIDRSLAKQIGEILQVDGVFFGTVSEFWYRTRASAAMQEEPAVGINVKLVDSITGKVVWAGSYSRSSYDISTYDRDSLNRVAQITVENMVDSIAAIKGVK